jgi:hypothetical protein
VPVWDAMFCMFPDGAAAYRATGKVCPQDEQVTRQKAALQQKTAAVVIPSLLGYSPSQVSYVSNGGTDPVVIQRLAGQ